MKSDRECYDCKFLKSKVSWWCLNDKAAYHRGTRVAGARNCKFHEVIEEDITNKRKNKKSLIQKIWDWIFI
jgi:hypothetical protein